MSGVEFEKSGWTTENLQKLLAAIEINTPKRYRTCAYTKGLKTVDWNKVAFPPFSPEACQEKWGEILHKMRKFRSITELIVEAQDFFSNPALISKLHPDFPKRPTPSNAKFYEDNCAKFQEQHPEMSHKKVVEVLYKKYNVLPRKEKAQYVKKRLLAMEEYKARVLEFRKQYKCPDDTDADIPDTFDKKENCIERPKGHKERKGEKHTEGAEGLPAKPPINGYNIFCKEQIASMSGIAKKDYVSVWAKRWRDLTEKQREEYSVRCRTLKRKYTTELDEYLKTLDKEEQQRILKENGIKIPKQRKGEQHTEGAEGLPAKPPTNGYNIFCKEQIASMSGIATKDYVSVWAKRWRDLTEGQREEYSVRCRTLKRKYATELNEYLKTLDKEEQQRILKENGIKIPKQRKGINRKVRHVIQLPGEPKMPSRSGNVIFCKKQMELLQEEFPNAKERFLKVNQSWQKLSLKEKERYKKKAQENFRKYLMELQKWFKALTAAEQRDFQKHNPSKCQYLKVKQIEVEVGEEPCLNIPSDSEDEDIEDSSSDEEVVNLDWDEDEEEEEEEKEEEDDIIFEMY
ncbi:nucleolar transcription factor 1-A-like isoform X1 [Seriola aureovittata]|uniref:nucleolar transcription factor 1-A-like isoform X1 n=1 Tax=Seriola aureovittata TaxID=2871759 RepID=UPI0024BDA75A|nr:nucleolar transcription factor 1-A-like isoform X1 [Seriola aureovittata]